MRTTPGVFALLVATVACLTAVAYAASSRQSSRPAPDPERDAGGGSLPRPTITVHPDKLATMTSARFTFTAKGRNPRFQCRLDARPWIACRTPVAFTKLAAGSHSFSVRTLGQSGRRSRAARFRWRVLEPQDFSIMPRLVGLADLYPGAPPQPLPVTIANPNPVPILVTSLGVTATADPLGCPSAENLLLIDSSVSSAAPVRVPAGGSVSLPVPGASSPAIGLRDLPVNQDACQRARFPLAFSGKARG